MDFVKRPKKEPFHLGAKHTWMSKCKQYKVTVVIGHGYAEHYLALYKVVDEGGGSLG